MYSDQQHHATHLFTVRLWLEALGDGRQERRGKVQHVASGDACHFRDWTTLEAFLSKKLQTPADSAFRINKKDEESRGNPAGSEGH